MKIFKPKDAKDIEYKKILGFDIETSGENNDFVLACFYSEDIKQVCNTIKEVKDFINQAKIRNYNIYATNLAFDFLGCFYQYSDNWDINERKGTIYSFKWYQKNIDGKLSRPVNFYDTMRILPFSVEKLGKLLKIPKLKHPKCFGKLPKNINERIELTKYCMNDAKISYKFIRDVYVPILKKYKIPIKQTIGSTALADFQTNHLKETFFQEPEINREIAFKSYYGGRTETYKRGLFENVYCFDVNSLYPSAMLNAMPNPNKSEIIEESNYNYIKLYEGVSHVLVDVPSDMKIPPLPYKKDGKLIFPTGQFKGWYNHNELRNAIKYGVTVKQVYKSLIYRKTGFYFKSYVETHYNERLKLQTENSPLQVMEKNLLNNLYGKFAFNYKQTSQIIPAHKFDHDKHVKNSVYVEPIANNTFFSVESLNNEAPAYSFPIWSSYITSYARIKMYEYLANIQLQDRIISTDTDSVFIENYNNEITTSSSLGAMKLEEGYPVQKGYFVRPKFYMTEKPKCKGVKFNDKQQFYDLLHNKDIQQVRFVKFRTAIRSQEHHKFGILKPNNIIKITKKCDLEDTKRLWDKDFEPFERQTSKPLYIHYLIEEQLQKHKQTEEQLKYNIDHKSFVHEIIDLDKDLIDWDAKGDDITAEEWIKNEFLSY